MNKKQLLLLVVATTLALAFTSCKKDVSEEELLKNQLAQTDSLLKRGGVIKYTVKLVSAANSSMLKAAMSLKDAEVIAYQNDSMYTAKTDANGFVTFANMRIGTVAVHVKLTGHAEVDYIADITPAENLVNLSQTQIMNTVRYASTMVPMFPIADPGCATITGKVTAELDLTNTTPEPAPDVKVTATVDVDDPDFVARYIAPTQGTTSSPNAGRILKYAFSDASTTATTAADGTYTLKVPASVNGLPVKLSVGDYQASQKLYLENDPADGSFKPGEYTVPVLFSSNVEPSPIPVVKPVYVVVDEPTAPIGTEKYSAKFSFEVDAQGGITKVNVLSKGNYSAKPVIGIFGSGNGKGALLDAVYNPNTGEIDNINIISSGIGYDAIYYKIYARIAQIRRKAHVEFVVENDGSIYNTSIIEKGIGYFTDNLNYTIITPLKNTTKPNINIIMDYWKNNVYKVELISPGMGFKEILNYSTNNIQISFINDKKQFTLSSNGTLIKNIYLGTGIR
jgi:hypothetical protein